MSKFVHLHVHTEYSLLDGLSNIKKLFAYTKENEMDAIAITDHGVMYGEIEFYKESLKQGVKPLLGMEGYITDGKLQEKVNKKNYHLLLLAKDLEGYKNLMKLSSIAHMEGFYYRPRFDHETLKKYSKGLIATSTCPQGEVGQALINDDYDKAKDLIQKYLDIFGDDYYLEMQRHEHLKWSEKASTQEIKTILLDLQASEDKWNEGILKLSRQMGVAIVATNDAHYIKKEDALAQDALVCVATGKNMSETKRLRYIDTETFNVRPPSEMEELFHDLPDAIENTLKVADKCNVQIELGKWFFPKYPLPEGKTADEVLWDLSHKEIYEKFEKVDDTAIQRLEYELGIIATKGYSPYFLIVRDLAKFARDNGIIQNTRGSAAGSLTSYVLGITTVDPLRYYLPFERFLNPYRPSPPDIDFDVADDKRDVIIDYITRTYGKDNVAQICTFGRMLSRAAVRDVARVLGYPYSIGDKIAKLIPPPKQGFPITIEKALSEVPELKSAYEADSDAKKVLDLARQLEGSARHISVHAAGVVVAPTEITDFAPIQKEPKEVKTITQYEMHACEDVGLIKFDILGIRNLSILGAAIDIVKALRGIQIDLHKIPIDDKKTFEMLARGETMGVFQMAGGGMTKYLKELKPNRVEDLMCMVALYRPGPISQIPEYIRRKANPKLVKYLDPRMEKFLGASYGLIVYQDDLLFCALDLAGYTWEEADKFRKAVGKKIPEEMAAQKDKLTKGLIEHGQTQEFADTLWKLFEPFQSYGFNKAHAASYGMVSYYTAYMKANYPVEYMTALLTAEASDKEKVSAGINECRRMNIPVLPPSINESGLDFTIEDSLPAQAGSIRFGLSAIKNVGEVAINIILEARKEGKFKDFSEFISRVDGRKVNKKVLESLIKVGAMDEFGKRSVLLSVIDQVKDKMSKPKGDDNQFGLFATDVIDKTSALDSSIIFEDKPEFEEDEIVNFERELMGFSLSAKPIGEIIAPYEDKITHKINDFSMEETYKEQVCLAVVITEVRVIATKKTGAQMCFAKAEDGTGTIELVVFPKVFQDTKNVWETGTPVLLKGKVDHKDESINILVDSATKLENPPVRIKIPNGTSPEIMKKVKDLLMENSGDREAFIDLEGKKLVKLSFKIKWGKEIEDKINQLLYPIL